jgi:hypothetical protein
MARCGCAGFGTCNCLVGGSGSVEVTGTGGQSDAYVVIGPTLTPSDTSGFDVTITGNGKMATPWVVSVTNRAYTTGTRPNAATAGDGAMIYDTTLNKPLWSDGSVWRDATGTAA